MSTQQINWKALLKNEMEKNGETTEDSSVNLETPNAWFVIWTAKYIYFPYYYGQKSEINSFAYNGSISSETKSALEKMPHCYIPLFVKAITQNDEPLENIQAIDTHQNPCFPYPPTVWTNEYVYFLYENEGNEYVGWAKRTPPSNAIIQKS